MTKVLKVYPKDRKGMYTEQFHLLRAGDIIKGASSGIEREILHTSGTTRNPDVTIFITVPMIGHSRFRGNTVAIDCGQARDFLPVEVKNRKIWTLTRGKVISNRKKIFKSYKTQKIKRLRDQLKILKSRG